MTKVHILSLFTNQCGGSGSGWIRVFSQDQDPDPGLTVRIRTWIRIRVKMKTRIRNKWPGSTTLLLITFTEQWQDSSVAEPEPKPEPPGAATFRAAPEPEPIFFLVSPLQTAPAKIIGTDRLRLRNTAQHTTKDTTENLQPLACNYNKQKATFWCRSGSSFLEWCGSRSYSFSSNSLTYFLTRLRFNLLISVNTKILYYKKT